jgi:hypothetical protein
MLQSHTRAAAGPRSRCSASETGYVSATGRSAHARRGTDPEPGRQARGGRRREQPPPPKRGGTERRPGPSESSRRHASRSAAQARESMSPKATFQ